MISDYIKIDKLLQVDYKLLLRIHKFKNSDQYGVTEGSTDKSLSELLDDNKLCVVRFIYIDFKNGIVFYDDAYRSVVDSFFYHYFNVGKSALTSNLSIEEFYYLTQIKIIDTTPDLFSYGLKGQVDETANMLLKGTVSPKKTIHTYEYSPKSGMFNFKKAKKAITNLQNTNFRKITLIGYAKNGDEIQYTGEEMSRRIEVLPQYKKQTWIEYKNIDMLYLMSELEMVYINV